MHCPFCSAADTRVKDSRLTEENNVVRRRRYCDACRAKFTTYERVQLRDLTVRKNNGSEQPFDRNKLARSVYTALRKRPIHKDDIEKLISGIVRQLEMNGDTTILSRTIGASVVRALAQVDGVAYIRFVSVYNNFQNPDDFEQIIANWREQQQQQQPPDLDN